MFRFSIKAFFFGCAALFGAFVLPSVVLAAPLTWSSAETISIASPSTTLTIAAGSVADVFQVNATSVVVTMSGSTGGTFTLTAASSFDLTTTGGTPSYSCISNITSVALSAAATYVVTPVAGQCVPGSSPSPSPATVSVGVGGSYASNPATSAPAASSSSATSPSSSASPSDADLQAEIVSLTVQLNALLAQAAGGGGGGTAPGTAVSPSSFQPFLTAIRLGNSGPSVSELQRFLAQNSAIYPEGNVTGYFGALTLRAVQRFQFKYGLAKPSQAFYGYVGPATRTKLNALIEEGLSP